ncbi:preprotein translocase subunit SecG [Tateyamaria sp. SN6-1]|uniref:preprotein translocase subunit SecG n=1 Tax=Tateyamaria sp. SN6-1 TaxID=3092148 RepID=UPI0039F5547A
MENVVLIIHLILALGLVAVVLLQRSEGGGLGMGGGGGAATGRAPATAMGKVTWILAIAFIITSITLTIMAARNASGTSVIDQLGITPPAQNAPADDLVPPGGDLLPPSTDDTGPLVPSAD